MPAKTIGHFLFLLTCGFFLPSLALAQYAQKNPSQSDSTSRAVVEKFFELLSKDKVEEAANLISENVLIQPQIKVKEFVDLIRNKKILNNPKLDRKTIIAEGDRIAVEVDSKDKFTNPDGTPFLTDVRYGIHCEVRDSKIMKMDFFMSGMCWPCPVFCATRPNPCP
jgi:ketosteroid isomerase-like protein